MANQSVPLTKTEKKILTKAKQHKLLCPWCETRLRPVMMPYNLTQGIGLVCKSCNFFEWP